MRRLILYLFFAANLFVVFGFWWQGSAVLIGTGPAGVLIALGRASGLLAAVFVLLQFALIGRNVFVERAFGLDRLAHFHHWTGFLAIFFVILHPILIVNGYARLNGTGLLGQFGNFFTDHEDVFQAFVGALLLMSIVFLSLYVVRKRLRYETWYFTHLLTYAAIALAWGHQLENGGDFLGNVWFVAYWYALYTAVFGSLLFFRFLRPLWIFHRHRFRVSRIEPASPDVTSVHIAVNDMDRFKVLPGQFLMFRFLTWELFMQNHPFSVSMIPRDGELRFTAKHLGDFTATLRTIPLGTSVFIDGPFGVFRPEQPAGRKFLFVAGGIGITPIRSILESLPDDTDSVLLYGSRSSKDVVLKDELDLIASQKKIIIHHVMSDEPEFVGEKGHIDMALIRSLASDFAEREIFLCGPPPMIRALREGLMAAGVPKKSIRYERFSLH